MMAIQEGILPTPLELVAVQDPPPAFEPAQIDSVLEMSERYLKTTRTPDLIVFLTAMVLGLLIAYGGKSTKCLYQFTTGALLGATVLAIFPNHTWIELIMSQVEGDSSDDDCPLWNVTFVVLAAMGGISLIMALLTMVKRDFFHFNVGAVSVIFMIYTFLTFIRGCIGRDIGAKNDVPELAVDNDSIAVFLIYALVIVAAVVGGAVAHFFLGSAEQKVHRARRFLQRLARSVFIGFFVTAAVGELLIALHYGVEKDRFNVNPGDAEVTPKIIQITTNKPRTWFQSLDVFKAVLPLPFMFFRNIDKVFMQRMENAFKTECERQQRKVMAPQEFPDENIYRVICQENQGMAAASLELPQDIMAHRGFFAGNDFVSKQYDPLCYAFLTMWFMLVTFLDWSSNKDTEETEDDEEKKPLLPRTNSKVVKGSRLVQGKSVTNDVETGLGGSTKEGQ